jgi:hypothetical protein
MPNLFVFDYIISIYQVTGMERTAIPEFVEAGYTYHHDCQQPFNLSLAPTLCGWGDIRKPGMGLCVEVISTASRMGRLGNARYQYHFKPGRHTITPASTAEPGNNPYPPHAAIFCRNVSA